MTPSIENGYFILNQAASIPPYDPPNPINAV